MSIFSGIVDEYPFLSIDNFNPLVSTYFLTHLHIDHIEGFRNFTGEPPTKIYTSELTFKLMQGRYTEFKFLLPCVVPLNLGQVYDISVNVLDLRSLDDDKETENIKVKLIPAGHCLGSVMFLIDGKNGRILYSGDIRVDIGETPKLIQQYGLSDIDILYLDTTFMQKTSIHLPSREETMCLMYKKIEDYLQKHPDNMVYISQNTRYTIEVLYHLLYARMNIKTHVNWNSYVQYRTLDEDYYSCMDHTNINSRVHAYCIEDTDTNSHLCKNQLNKARNTNRLLTVKPSTYWWTCTSRNRIDKMCSDDSEWLCSDERDSVCRVLFSSHSSAIELADFIRHLAPKKEIRDCVHGPDNAFIQKIFQLGLRNSNKF